MRFFVCVVQAAVAWVAATVAVRVIFSGILLCWNWILDLSVGVFIVSRERNISLQGKDEEASNLQALIRGAKCVEGLVFLMTARH